MKTPKGLHGRLHKDIHCCTDQHTFKRGRSLRPTFLTIKQSLTGGLPSSPRTLGPSGEIQPSKELRRDLGGRPSFSPNGSCYQRRPAPTDYLHSWHSIGPRLKDQPPVSRHPKHRKSLQADISQTSRSNTDSQNWRPGLVDPQGNQLQCKALPSDIAFPQFTVL